MVFVKVRETYDLHTIRNKMSVIGIHTPKADIIKRNYPGLLLQCKGYRPVSCDVRLACASMLPLDPQGVGTAEGDVAPEDVFNPILYKAVSNRSFSQIEAYIEMKTNGITSRGDSIEATNSGILEDDFNIYYGLLADTHSWKHASPQAGLEMRGLKPLVYEMNYNIGQQRVSATGGISDNLEYLDNNGRLASNGMPFTAFLGKAKPMPMLWSTGYMDSLDGNGTPVGGYNPFGHDAIGTTPAEGFPNNLQLAVPAPRVYCGIICVPPSRLHQLFYRLVCEWTLEFSEIRSMGDITSWSGLAYIGQTQHTKDYDFDSKMLVSETAMVDTTEGSEIKKVM